MLDSPPPGKVRLVPLGGLGEVGMNCLALEQGEDIVVVDCGIRFPHDDLGVDVVHPDMTWLIERKERIRGIFLTHGHEDHIGALPYLLDRVVDVPVFGPPHAVGLVRHRLAERGFGSDDVDFEVVQPRETYDLGSFSVEPIRVAHSIVEATALAITTQAGRIVHTGDFKLEHDPPDGEPTDERRLTALGDEGVALLLSDSTNIDVPRPSGTERTVGAALDDIVRGTDERVFIALFSSNIQRLMLIGDIARRTGRKICVLGKSLLRQIEVATDIGRLHWSSDLRISPADARMAGKADVLFLVGGTQGEPNSALARLAAGTHPDLSLVPGDVVVLSSRIIPGNDLPVFHLMAGLIRRGVRLESRVTHPGVHTSGHATREEQARMLQMVRPRCFLPVHGTRHHLERHAELARVSGVTEVCVVENGASVLFDGERLSVEGTVQSGTITVGFGGVPLDTDVLRERREMARTGVASVALAIDGKRVLAGVPSVTLRGIGGLGVEGGSTVRKVQGEAVRAVERAVRRRVTLDEIREDVRRAVRRALLDVGGVRPVVEVHLVEVQ